MLFWKITAIFFLNAILENDGVILENYGAILENDNAICG